MPLLLKDAIEKDEWLLQKQHSSCILFNMTYFQGHEIRNRFSITFTVSLETVTDYTPYVMGKLL